jgi:hypothetical protein
LAADGDFCSDCVAFMPDEGLVASGDFDSVDSWLIWPAEDPADDGPLCMVEPADDPPSRLVPVPCALAKPVPAIKAAAATEIKKRLVMEFLLTCFALPALTTKADA